ncbi:hypothetical protein STCU_04375 [Strigomonas culicis]|uniref:Uncharacterized protein n=1 Tax=Strigomonas culicis TaxID=28005 RepID=S9VRH2_9TRYP|nr:hypothetical protein STCU_04375 [Strigomonas culicis]|eukprot:EPY29646.1 hypothetical protein STCU_04375 [Strigomonas culicis]
MNHLMDDHKEGTMAYAHQLLNKSFYYYQVRDYMNAKRYAENAHQKALEINKNSSFVFLTSQTCYHCHMKVAEEYEKFLQEYEAHNDHFFTSKGQADGNSSLKPNPSVVFNANRAIRQLQKTAQDYKTIATRIYNKPENAFMRSSGTRDSHAQRRTTSWEESSSASAYDQDYEDNFYQYTATCTRRRPEHAEIRNFYKAQSGSASPSGPSAAHPTMRRKERMPLHRRHHAQNRSTEYEWKIPK